MKIIISTTIITSILFALLLIIIRENSILNSKIIQLNSAEPNKVEQVNQDPYTMPSFPPDHSLEVLP